VVREGISDLLLDSVPAQALMRTAILSAQSYGNEMKKFMLSDVIPSMIRQRVWVTAPKVSIRVSIRFRVRFRVGFRVRFRVKARVGFNEKVLLGFDI
jgi:hypothetical protein